jgi:hypothetical protein
MLRRSFSAILSSSKQQRVVKQVNALTKQSVQHYHVSKTAENQLIIGGLVVATSAMAIRYGLEAVREFKAKQPAQPEGEIESESKVNAKTEPKKADAKKGSGTDTSTANSPFASWFAKNFYDGGFEEKMSKREAALILGVRESATPERIKEAHRRILLLNHPDRGGSAHIAAKINEAKDLLLKGKQ